MYTHGGEALLLVEEARHTHHRVELEQSHCRDGRGEVHLSGGQLLLQRIGQCLGIDFQPYCQRSGRAHPRTHAAQIGSGDGLVQLERAAPEGLVSKRVIPERLPTLRYFRQSSLLHRMSCRIASLTGGWLGKAGTRAAAQP